MKAAPKVEYRCYGFEGTGCNQRFPPNPDGFIDATHHAILNSHEVVATVEVRIFR